jgi:ribokinase
MRAAVIGHVEWVEFLEVERVPRAGEIVHARGSWEGPGGGGAVAAVQLNKLADEMVFFTALGDDDRGHRALLELVSLGLRVEAASRQGPSRRAITYIDADGERTITVMGERLAPRATDRLPWEELAGMDAIFVTAGDVDLLRMARRARVLTATARVLPLLAMSGTELDALIGSDRDASEPYSTGQLNPEPRLVVRTRGADGGIFTVRGEQPRGYAPAPLPGPVVDRFGAGDSFMAALTYALGAGKKPEEAVAFAARCGASVVTGRGPYEGQIRLTGEEP